ncbi:MAG: amino-acid N-acetyltransferase [Chromatiales bacterium]|nr:amino-acid N-acetyltransferase [Chromatiales bacterium]
MNGSDSFVQWFRDSSPYIQAHRGKTFVLVFSGEEVEDPGFANLVHDFALLHNLGIRLVLVHGVRPQIEARLRRDHGISRYDEDQLRVTDDAAMACVKEAVGAVRVEIESRLSMGLANAPGLSSTRTLRVCSGNFVTAQPLGVHNGVDYQHTGEVRRIDTAALNAALDNGSIALLSPIGYSPTGESFNLSADEVGLSAATALKADKFMRMVAGEGLLDENGETIRQLSPADAETILKADERVDAPLQQALRCALTACRSGVRRAHLVGRHDGALLRELFTRDGIGTLITEERYEILRAATIDDVGGILELIAPLEAEGVLVRRSRERLEMEIERFWVIERDGMIIACAGLYPQGNLPAAELACLAVHPAYRRGGRGDDLLQHLEKLARIQGVRELFVLTTRTAHWFLERGFLETDPQALPLERRELYNWQRRSKVFVKVL